MRPPAPQELAAQVHRLVTRKMEVHWDLLSLQDPMATKEGTDQMLAPGIRDKLSIREFSLVEPLGSGGYGTVWLASRRRTGDLVAVKVLHTHV